MAEMNFEDIVAKLDLLQETVLSIDEKSRRNLESIARLQIEVAEIKGQFEFVRKELQNLGNEINELTKPEEV